MMTASQMKQPGSPNRQALLLLFSALCHCSRAFVLPGVAPLDYNKGDSVEIKAVKLTSDKAQLPYEYYSLPFCKPEGPLEYKSENLGWYLLFVQTSSDHSY